MTATIGLFYGSSTCYTEMAAEKIRDQFDALLGAGSIALHNVIDTPLSAMADYPFLIAGIPTWDYGELQEDWEARWDEFDTLALPHCRAAVFGLGDQVGYPEWFQDALGYLWTRLQQSGAKLAGEWPNSGYTFTGSQALTADQRAFVGLALDDENQFDQSDERIAAWCRQLIAEFGLAD